jgi:hypothetical protein
MPELGRRRRASPEEGERALTHLCHSPIDFAVTNNSAFRCGRVRRGRCPLIRNLKAGELDKTDGRINAGNVGRWSRLVAREFVNWLGGPRDSEWLDIGCGTGTLCETILQTVPISTDRRLRLTAIAGQRG